MRFLFTTNRIIGIKILLCVCVFVSCSNKNSNLDNKNTPSSGIKKPSSSAYVTFLDGTKLKIDDFKFQYEWMFEDDKKYFNPPTYTTESEDVHYCEISHGVEHDVIIPRDSISSIVFNWPEDILDGEYRSPITVIVTLKNGFVKKIKTCEYKLAKKFLINDASNERRLIQFNQLNLIGVVVHDQNKENFFSSISMFGALEVRKAESAKEISF